jgi:iron-sulfur cluster repair protein YtfE (RIC family)
MFLSGPIDIIRSFHNAFRRDLSQIDAASFKLAKTEENMNSIFDRLSIVSEVLDYHAQGEEVAVFPALEKLTPHVSQAYFLDHRELDTMIDNLEIIQENPDPLTTARATAVLESHLRIHLNKEDAHLYPLLKERTTTDEQTEIVRKMSGKVPPKRFPVLIQWLLPLLDFDDRVVITEGWMTMMPPQVFANLKPLLKKLMASDWIALTQRIPHLTNESI